MAETQIEQSVLDALSWVTNSARAAEAAYKEGKIDDFKGEIEEAHDELNTALCLACPDDGPLIETLTKRVTAYFQGDPSAPSIITAWLDKKGTWYTSVARYHGKMGQEKEIVAKAMDQSLQACYKQLGVEFDAYRQLVAIAAAEKAKKEAQ